MYGMTSDPSTVELIKKQYALYKKYTSSTRLQLESVKEKTKGTQVRFELFHMVIWRAWFRGRCEAVYQAILGTGKVAQAH